MSAGKQADAARFDTIIVGAGSAGAILAARLTEDERRSVCLVEAGPDYSALELLPERVRLLQFGGARDDAHEWGYLARATDLLLEMPVPRGRVVGGSSSINGTVLLRALRADLDSWSAMGNPGWDYAACEPYFRKLEADRDFPDAQAWRRRPDTRDAGSPRGLGAGQSGVSRRVRRAGLRRLSGHEPARRARRRSDPVQLCGWPALRHGGGVPDPQPVAGQPEPVGGDAGLAHRVRRPPRAGRRDRSRRRSQHARSRPGHRCVRRHRLASAVDALGYWPGGSPARARHRAAARPAGRRSAPARPPVRRDGVELAGRPQHARTADRLGLAAAAQGNRARLIAARTTPGSPC